MRGETVGALVIAFGILGATGVGIAWVFGVEHGRKVQRIAAAYEACADGGGALTEAISNGSVEMVACVTGEQTVVGY